jgi:glyoxylate/hydroxypyruvate reductase
MALLLIPLDDAPSEWRRAFAAELPDLEIRIWPEIGDPSQIETAAIGPAPHGALAGLPNLRMIASLPAGQETLLSDPTLPRHVPIVRACGPGGDPMMNETALLHVLRHHRQIPEYLLHQQRREWKELPRPLAGASRVGVMGLGLIGLAMARTIRAHGFDVAGWARKPRDIAGIQVFHGPEQLPAFLGRSEIVVNILALTKATENILCRATFAMMPRGAQLINLARGQHVVDADLIAALDSGQLSAATLDVARLEPLPPDDPLWSHPRITITPHVARSLVAAELVPSVCENLRRLHQGLPLLHLVDPEAGY